MSGVRRSAERARAISGAREGTSLVGPPSRLYPTNFLELRTCEVRILGLPRLYEKPSNTGKPPRHEANHGSIYQRLAARTQPLVIFAHPPCILVLVVHNAATMGATDRFLLGPGFAKTAEQSTRRRARFLEEPERLPGPML